MLAVVRVVVVVAVEVVDVKLKIKRYERKTKKDVLCLFQGI